MLTLVTRLEVLDQGVIILHLESSQCLLSLNVSELTKDGREIHVLLLCQPGKASFLGVTFDVLLEISSFLHDLFLHRVNLIPQLVVSMLGKVELEN